MCSGWGAPVLIKFVPSEHDVYYMGTSSHNHPHPCILLDVYVTIHEAHMYERAKEMGQFHWILVRDGVMLQEENWPRNQKAQFYNFVTS